MQIIRSDNADYKEWRCRLYGGETFQIIRRSDNADYEEWQCRLWGGVTMLSPSGSDNVEYRTEWQCGISGGMTKQSKKRSDNTPWSRVLLEDITGYQLVKKFSAFYGTRRFITAFTSARQLSLSSARTIRSINLHPTSWRSNLILSSRLCLCLSCGSFPQISSPKLRMHLSSPHPCYMPL